MKLKKIRKFYISSIQNFYLIKNLLIIYLWDYLVISILMNYLFLIDNNDYKNLNNILNNCNLKIKKIIAKNFIEGVNLINENKNLNTFFKIQINQTNSHISFFENSSLKFFQEFKFGSNLIIKDISKVIGLNIDEVKNIINSLILFQKILKMKI